MSAGTHLDCPTCGAPRLATDRFCEGCGASLAAAGHRPADSDEIDVDATLVRAPRPATPDGCHACAAPEEAIGSDGYCLRCGAMRRGQPEHHEVDVIVAAAVSDQGRVHRRNEDAFYLEVAAEGAVVAVLCDGISSSHAPHLAAQRGAQTAGSTLVEALRSDSALSDATAAATRAAQRAVRELMNEAAGAGPPPVGDVPACTLVSGAYRDGELVVSWVGDSRAFWISHGDSRQLTVDDSWATEQIDAGLLSPEQALADPRAHAITRWLGADAPEDAAQVTALQTSAPGRLVLCTDGLWNYAARAADVAGLIDVLPPDAPALAVARSLVNAALESGGRDNVTVAVIDVCPPRREIS